MNKNQIAALARNCARYGCLQVGKWVPVLVIKLVGQTAVEKPVLVGIPLYLCDKHKTEFEPNHVLSLVAKAKLAVQVVATRGKKLNWDTLEVEWRTEKDAIRVLSTDEGGRPN